MKTKSAPASALSTTGRAAQVSSHSTPCSLCGADHDEIIAYLAEHEYRRIPDGDMEAETAYTERELRDDPGRREPGLRHRLAVLKSETQRRRRIAARGGPLYRGRTSIPAEQIAAIRKNVNIAEIIARDLDIAWMRSNRTYFHCPAHGSGRDRNPSLVSYDDQGTWWCFGCNSGGDAIDWMIGRRGMSFRQAVEALT